MEEYNRLTKENKILQPGFLGKVRTRNRVIMAPMATNFCGINGEVTPQMISYYAARAQGGVGAVIVEAACVDYPIGTGGLLQLRIDKDFFGPGLSRLAESIKAHGAKAFIQLSHTGGNANPAIAGTTPAGPSAVSYKVEGQVARELEQYEIPLLIDTFVKAALRAKKAGFDGVEIHGGHAYLIAQFLSPVLNLRTDEYGGSTEKRTRFAKELVKAVRQSVGDNFALIFRISGDEFIDGGRTIEETGEIVKILDKAGVDAFHITAGSNRFSIDFSHTTLIETPSYPEAWKTYLATFLKQKTTKPVIAVGVIRSPGKATEIIESGQADFVALGRGLLCDPEWVNKFAAGQSSLINRCISCRDGCANNRHSLNREVRCALNPIAGRESLTPQITVNNIKNKSLAVIGGGPAGMTAAIWASRFGFRVELFEKASKLGGQLCLAQKPPNKDKIGWVISDLKSQLEYSDVKVHFDHAVTEKNAHDLSGFDYVIVANGSIPREPGFCGLDSAVSSDDFLREPDKYLDMRVKKVVISGGGTVACETALMIRQAGCDVTMVCYPSDIIPGSEKKAIQLMLSGLEPLTRFELLKNLQESNVNIVEGKAERKLTKDGLDIGNSNDLIQGDLYIASTPRVPMAESLRACLESECSNILYIGDSVKVGNIMDAVHDAYYAVLRMINVLK